MLLDTHALIWWFEDAPQLSSAARKAIEEPSTAVYFSPVSVFELENKAARGKLRSLRAPLVDLAQDQGFLELPINARHADLAARLPAVHRDPWDRLLAAQGILEGMSIVTRDPRIAALGATALW